MAKLDHLRVNRENDRRVKITEENKEEIKEMYKQGISIREITRNFNFSRRSIQLILFPERLEKQKEDYKLRRLDGRYYNKEKHRKAMKKHRDYKKKLLKNNKIKI